MKAYIVSKYGICDDCGTTIGVYLNKEKCDKDVDELNKPREAEELIYEECCKCRNDEYGSPDDIFRLRDVCKMASIKTDRNGDYCENDRSSYYSMKTDSYYVEETNIIE